MGVDEQGLIDKFIMGIGGIVLYTMILMFFALLSELVAMLLFP